MRVWRWAIGRPVATLMAVGVVVWAGLFALRTLPVGLLPALDPPVLTVVTSFPGASPDAIDELVGEPVTQALSTVSGLRELVARSGDGASVVVARFRWGTDLDAARDEVHRRLDALSLPQGAGRPRVLQFDPNQLPVLEVSLAGAGNREELARLARQQLVPRLEAVPGVAAVSVRGAPQPRVEVTLDAAALRRHGLTPAQVQAAVAAAATGTAAGTVREPDGQRRWPVQVEGGFDGLEDLGRVVVGLSSPVLVPPRPPEAGAGGVGPSGAPGGSTAGKDPAAGSPGVPAGAPVPAGAVPVRLADVATLAVRSDPGEQVERVNGRDGLSLVIYPQPGANTVSVARAVRATLSDLLASAPGLQATVTYDGGRLVERAVGGVARSLLVGSLLAVAVLWAFLRDGRAVAVIAAAIPVSACATLAAMHLTGMTLNVMSLGGLALSAGVLVDQAIVVLESVARQREEGRAPAEAADRGTAEVAAAITGSTVTNLIVFLPVVFLGGLSGQLFRDLAATNTLAQLASLVVAVTLVPALASWWMRAPAAGGVASGGRRQASRPGSGRNEARDAGQRPATGHPSGHASGHAGGSGERASACGDGAGGGAGGHPGRRPGRPDRVHGGPVLPRWVEACLARPAATLLAGLALVLASLPVAARLGTEFLPAVDEGAVDVAVTLPAGSTLEQAEDALRRVEDTVARQPGVEFFVSRAGAGELPGQQAGPHQGLVRVQLAAGAGSSAAWAARLRRQLAADPELRRRQAEVAVRPRSLWADVGAAAPVVELAVRAADPARLQEAVDRVRRALAAVPGLRDVAADLDRRQPELELEVDAAAAARLGLLPAQVGQQVRLALAGDTVARARVDGQWVPVVVRLDGGTAGGGAGGGAGGSRGEAGGAPAVPGAGGHGGTARGGQAGRQPDAAAPGDAPGAGRGALAGAEVTALGQLPLAGGGGWTRLGQVAVVRPGETAAAVVRRDGLLTATVTARVDGLDFGTALARARQAVAAGGLPPGVTVDPAGTAVLMEEGFSTLVPAAAGALMLVYMVMAAQFESWRRPLLIMVTLPLALVGSVAGLALAGYPVGLTAIMGAIVLAGIAVNNGIVLVDAAIRERAAGAGPGEAIRRAWRRRLRPVLMTALTTLLGALPMVLAPDRGGELEAPLAAVLVGGLCTSTALTLVVLPCGWLLLERQDRPGMDG